MVSSEKHAIRYRPDIDGLRAVAVLAVVFYHAELAPLPAGYMGVDVFFVISGYLITGVLLQDASIIRFYQRRARRILPALFALLAVTLGVGTLIMLPHDLTALAESTAATLGFASNMLFWRISNYFAHETQLWPLLHTWSLGVEEQFYILFPLLVRFVRLPPRRMAILFGLLALLSFTAAAYAVTHRNATPAFYLSPLRAWELLIGSVLATGAIPEISRAWMRSAVAITGLVAILLPMLVFRTLNLFPGISALPPVLGAAALIWAGTGGRHALSPLLSAKPVIFVGLISYSLYLWHWPILAFARYLTIDPLTSGQALAAVAATMVLATLSWRFIERPFRRRSIADRTIWLFSVGGIAALLAVSGAVIAAQGMPGRFAPEITRLNGASDRTWRCPLTNFVRFGNGLACPIGPRASPPQDAEVILWGDSHAQMYAPALMRALGNRPGLLVNAYGCAPVLGEATTPACGTVQRANYATIVASPARTVILAQNWLQTRDEGSIQLGRDLVPEERYQYGIRRLRALVRGLRHAGKQVILVGPIAVPGYDVAGVGSRELLFYGYIRHPTFVTRDDYLAETANIHAAMEDLAHDPGVRLIRVDQHACSYERCDYIQNGRAIFADHDHFSTSYSATLWPLFRLALTAASGGDAQGQRR